MRLRFLSVITDKNIEEILQKVDQIWITHCNEHVNLIAPDCESQISLESEQEQEYTEKDWKNAYKP